MDLETPGAGLAIVTGAAGGMGSAIAGRLGKDGFELLLCDLDSAALEAVAAGVGTGRKVEILAADVASRGFGAQLLNAVAGRRIGALAKDRMRCAHSRRRRRRPTMSPRIDGGAIAALGF